ncbi:TIGR03086 family metal-binding protein [Actinokineospora iranica]|uniref:TIGR03086 family protein n=1 Tax=Actinokineospora iranica TaxID=1271860 RepID=A0A1G6PH66_9PSEU|nr:TIGR03086 family metal-binding protein [Actinokineospora iranica]SDC79378.1 TIGR03086 family protein [Actinokineospora iranica]
MDGILELDRRAVEASTRVVSLVPDDAWDSPTPCSAWVLRELLEHMIAQNRGFAAAAAGNGDLDMWRVRPLGDDPKAEYAESARLVLDAFAEDGVLAREFPLSEITTQRTFPAAQAISFHFLDYVVHAWDVGVSVGVRMVFDADVLDAALTVAHREVPVGPFREQPDASFAPVIEVAPTAPKLDRILAVLGRSPSWPR